MIDEKADPGSDAAAGSSPLRDAEPVREYSVLLVEDTPANQKVIRRVLDKHGYQVTVVENGRAAVDHATRRAFDVILMDVQLPVMDGFQATVAIRDQEQLTGRHSPIIAMTAHSTDRGRAACREAGMDAFLAKPIDMAELISVVESAIQRSRGDSLPAPAECGDGRPRAPAAAINLQTMLDRMGGDRELFDQFIDVFNEDAPLLIQQIASAVAATDSATALRAAHSLRGLAANFSATSIIELASEIETAAKQEELAQVARILPELSSAVDCVRAALESRNT